MNREQAKKQEWQRARDAYWPALADANLKTSLWEHARNAERTARKEMFAAQRVLRKALRRWEKAETRRSQKSCAMCHQWMEDWT